MLTCLTSNHFIQNGMEMNQMMSNTISILLLRGGGVPQRGEVVGEKIIPYLYDSSVFLALPTTPPSGHPSSDGGGELRYSIYLM